MFAEHIVNSIILICPLSRL